MAQHFGKTWWGQQWLKALNNIDYSNRLPRGSRYARNGSVTKINLDSNQIHARVAGSRPTPYKVDVILPPFFEPELSRFVDALAVKPVIISKLLNRELDPEVLSIAESMGLKVFPEQWTDFKMQCSCPDWAVPCKHLAAVIYKISAEIDNNPFLVFNLHRVDLIAEMNKRGLFVSQDNMGIPKIKDLYFKKGVTKKDLPEYNTDHAYKKLSYHTLSPIDDSLVALLAASPVFYPGQSDFKEKYSKALGVIVRKAQRILKGRKKFNDFLKEIILEDNTVNPHSTNKITIDKEDQTRVYVNSDAFSLPEFLAQIVQISHNHTRDYQPSTASLHTVFYLALHLIANGAIVPQIVAHSHKKFTIRWLPAMISKEVQALLQELEGVLPPDIFRWQQKSRERIINKDLNTNILSLFITELVAILRGRDDRDVFLDLFFRGQAYSFNQPGEEALSGGIQAWLQRYYLTEGDYRPQLAVSETEDNHFSIAINISEKAHPLEKPIPLSAILKQKKYEKKRFPILQSLAQLSHFIEGLDGHINSGATAPLMMNNDTFTPFLLQIIPAIRLLDIDVLLPKSLQEILKPRASIKVKRKKQGKSFLRLDKLLDFDWQIAIGDNVMTKKEFDRLLKSSDSLIKFKSQYFYVNHQELEKLYKSLQADKGLSSFQILRSALSGEYEGAKVTLTAEIKKLIKELTEFHQTKLPKGLHAKLRPYQKRGFSWLYRNAQIGFGSVIADDMGLGKTIQVITTLLKYREEGYLTDKKALIVVPTGLLTNWQAEIERFAPVLKTHIFHGTNRKLTDDFDVLLTSYGITRTEAKKFKKLPWHTLVIDEAQNIKNKETAQAKAIKSIPADNFIAMSGTPVENRLSELWSIMDYCNRGFLGSAKEFHESFGNPIETYNDEKAAGKLKKITAPFMMRRLKTDKSIISDLPEKIEMDLFAHLAKEQASLYEKTLEEALMEIEAIDTTDKKGLFVRQGIVLQMILALKQICNHPAQFLKNKVYDPALSGKIDLLFEKLDPITESGEKVLLFTQFKEMGDILQRVITDRYGTKPLFYHGGCNIKERREMIDTFQTNPADKIFILSLKAAGTGLNLTAANHVIHYDLWWNPAVEAQATDRAYRIGQKKNVMVHRFITKNTFEEKINDLIQSKKALAEMTVNTGESWIGQLSNTELKELFERG